MEHDLELQRFLAKRKIMENRKHVVFLAKLAEEAKRYDDMIEAMKKASELKGDLSIDERNLLSVGYKNVIDGRRASWRILSSIEKNEQSRGNEGNLKLINVYRVKIEGELSNICNQILFLIDKHLLPASARNSEALVFYNKLKGDYYRYLAEVKVDEEKKEAVDESMKGYQRQLSQIYRRHPTRLSVALSYSVFYYKILNNTEMACNLAKVAFDEAMSDTEMKSSESNAMIELLRCNLNLWTSELSNEDVVVGNGSEFCEIKPAELLRENLALWTPELSNEDDVVLGNGSESSEAINEDIQIVVENGPEGYVREETQLSSTKRLWKVGRWRLGLRNNHRSLAYEIRKLNRTLTQKENNREYMAVASLILTAIGAAPQIYGHISTHPLSPKDAVPECLILLASQVMLGTGLAGLAVFISKTISKSRASKSAKISGVLCVYGVLLALETFTIKEMNKLAAYLGWPF